MNRFLGHFKTITRHKLKVMKVCFKIGLYKQGLLHDLSKYSPIEFLVGVRYYQGYRSPIDKEKEIKGYSQGWLHHKGRNRHHWEYWLDFDSHKQLKGMPMPKKYIAEMFCDRVAASTIYLKEKYTDRSPLDYFLNSQYYIIMHPQIQATIERWLRLLAENGLDKTCAIIKQELKEDQKR